MYYTKPVASNYGISLLLSVLAEGVKAGVEKMYQDLGYIFYIPKGSLIDGEIVVALK